jgi:hypothetical protein
MTVIWKPQAGPQTALIQCPVFEVFFGGARGGGKTEGSLGDWLEHANTWKEAANGIFLRRTSKQLEEVIARSKELFTPIGAVFREQKGEWTMPFGMGLARLKFRYLERDSDAEEYQGHSYSRIFFEELTNFPSPNPINKMRATVRSARGASCGIRLTGNPGGPGHNWVKARYISPYPKGYKVLSEDFLNPFTKEIQKIERVFIPSKVTDNPLLLSNDPMYIARLHQSGSKELVKAWLEGNWDVIHGAFFDEFDTHKHVLESGWLRRIPRDALRFRAFDWGSAKPFSCGWYVVSDGTWGLPRNAILKYREWYGIGLKPDGTFEPDTGLKLTAEEVALGIKKRDENDIIKYSVADPQIFVRDGGPSIAERMMLGSSKVLFRAADRKRKAGWDQVRQRLKGENGVPMIYFLETCEHTIRTLPVLPHDEHDPEDIDTDAEDHAGDETRYGCMSRPYIPKLRPQESNVINLPLGLERHTFRQMLNVVKNRAEATL